MNMPKLGRRKAITPVLATVILIAMTLISAISVGGFVFGLFGNYANTAQVQAQLGSCSHTGTTCTLTLYNSGSANTSILTGADCLSVKYAGQTAVATSCSASTTTVVAGGSLLVTATFGSSFTATAGEQLSGQISLENGAIVLFSGSFL
jgi:flagellin-like protein